MFRKSTWMSKGYIAQAIARLKTVQENSYGEYTKNQVDGAAEGISCLEGSKPNYLTNIIKTDHPDRNMAVRLLTE